VVLVYSCSFCINRKHRYYSAMTVIVLNPRL
jgi:hypothetical protein